MEPRFETLSEKRFIGKRLQISFVDNQTFALWRQFMPRRGEIKNIVGIELYSIEVYPAGFFENFNPTAEFEKWAAVEVADFDQVPDDFEEMIAPAGIYAVFPYRGKASDAGAFYQYILTEWLPKSAYQLDDRPHLAVMGKKYKQEETDSEEEIWIPVKPK
jgi:AraC family transcriptional regulator